MRFEFATATRVIFGAGRAAALPELVRELGLRRPLVVTGRREERGRALVAEVGGSVFPVVGEPTVAVARAGMEIDCDGVIAIGGGSALDAGKAIAALRANGGDPLDYLEVVGRGLPLRRPSLPFVAVPTTAGTGSEVTRNAVLADPATGVKASLRAAGMLPTVALVDPDLLDGVPPDVLAACGMDALAQVIEPFVCERANPLTDALAREGIRRSARSLRAAVCSGLTPERREDLALTSLFGGLCLANSGLGAVHGFAAPLGGRFHAPHGAVCAALLGPVLEANLRALTERDPDSPALHRFDELHELLGTDPSGWACELASAIGIPGLARWGVTEADIPDLVARSRLASSMKANPVVLTDAELAGILAAAL